MDMNGLGASFHFLQTSKPVLSFGVLAATRTGQETAVAGAAVSGFPRRPAGGGGTGGGGAPQQKKPPQKIFWYGGYFGFIFPSLVKKRPVTRGARTGPQHGAPFFRG